MSEDLSKVPTEYNYAFGRPDGARFSHRFVVEVSSNVRWDKDWHIIKAWMEILEDSLSMRPGVKATKAVQVPEGWGRQTHDDSGCPMPSDWGHEQ